MRPLYLGVITAFLALVGLGFWIAGAADTASGEQEAPPDSEATPSEAVRPDAPQDRKEKIMTQRRHHMVETQIAGRDVSDARVLSALHAVERHHFVPEQHQAFAYNDRPLPIGEGQTISQPYIVGKMSELMELQGGEKVLEIGTGSGYQAAVLAKLAKEVYTIEIVEGLCKSSKELLHRLGYENVQVRCGDGYKGWPEQAPFDAIMVTAAPPEIPAPLIEQLKPGGRLVIPVGRGYQELVVLVKDADGGTSTRRVFPVRFVPMTGEAQRPSRP